MSQNPCIKRPVVIAALCALATPIAAQTYSEAPRGSETREDIIDSLRPQAEWSFGAPVEFMVGEVRVAQDVAFATVRAQRPGGEEIDIFKTPIALRQETDRQAGNGPTMEVLLQKSGRVWVPVHFGINSSEGWWYDPVYCPIWAAVIPEACP